MIHEENDITETSEDLARVKKQLKQGKHTRLVMRTEHLRSYEKVSQQNHYETMGVASMGVTSI